MTKSEILHALDCNTHSLFTVEFLDKVNAAFGTNIKPAKYKANPHDLKGLTLDNGASHALGIAAFNLAPLLCDHLKVKYESKLGRGFQVRACTEALRAVGHDKT